MFIYVFTEGKIQANVDPDFIFTVTGIFQIKSELARGNQQLNLNHQPFLHVPVEAADVDPENGKSNSEFEGLDVDVTFNLLACGSIIS